MTQTNKQEPKVYKVVGRKKPYSIYVTGMKGKDEEFSTECFVEAYGKYGEMRDSGNFWLVELLEPTENGKMVAHHKYKEI